jgi:transcription termination/antitermination protein NusG
MEKIMANVDTQAVPVVAVDMLAPSANPDMHWYVVHAYSGMEKSVERNIVERINRAGMQDKFGRILVPTEEVVEIKNGQRKTTERRFFPGYVFVEMVMNDDTWHLVKHTNKVTGFLGGAKTRPSPISDQEIQKIVGQMQEGSEKPRHKVEFVVGELIRIKDGPFTDFSGSVEEVNYDKNKVRVSVTIFGRSTPVELEFSQVEKT